jgi:hypothetical protein
VLIKLRAHGFLQRNRESEGVSELQWGIPFRKASCASMDVVAATPQGVLAFVEQVDALQKQLEAGDADLALQAQHLAALDADIVVAEQEVARGRESLAKRVREHAKFAAKAGDYRAVAERRERDRANAPLVQSRRERSERLASIQADMEAAVRRFVERCTAFRAEHDPSALDAKLVADLTRVQKLTREALEYTNQLQALQDSARQAAEAKVNTLARLEKVTAECAGACEAISRRYQHPLAHSPFAALRESLAAEAGVTATLNAEMAAAKETPEARAIAAASAATADSTHALVKLDDTCAAQRAHLARLRSESQRLDASVQQAKHDLNQLERRVRSRTDGIFDSAGAAVQHASARLHPMQRTTTVAMVQTDTTHTPGGAQMFSSVTRTLVQQQRVPLSAGVQQHGVRQPQPVFDRESSPPHARGAPDPIATGSTAKKRRRREPLVLDSDSGSPVLHNQAPLNPRALALANAAPRNGSGAAAAAPGVKTTYGSARKPTVVQQFLAQQHNREKVSDDPWGSR